MPLATPQPERMDVTGRAGETIALPIARGPATGYDWQLDLPQCVERAADGPPREVVPFEALGGSRSGCLQVTAPVGNHLITARLVRPWKPDEPIRVVNIHLQVA